MKNKKIVIAIAAAVAIIAFIVYFAYTHNIDYRTYKHSFNMISHYINSFGKYAVVAFIVIFTLRTLILIVPYSAMTIIGGSIFGLARGFTFSMISVFLSASLAFFVSRFLGKEFVQRILHNKVKDLNSKIGEHGFKIILLMRISALFPFDILSYAAGLTKVRYRDFIFGTVLGMVIETFSMTYFGRSLKHPFSKEFIIAVVLIVLTAVAPFLYNKYKKKKVVEETVVSEEEKLEEKV